MTQTYWPRWLALALPILYAIFSVRDIFLFAASLVLIMLMWLLWSRYPISLSLIAIAMASILAWPINLALTAASTVLLDRSLRLGNDRPWWFYASPLAAALLIALLLLKPFIAISLAIPTTYIVVITLISLVRFSTVRIVIRPGKELSAVAGATIIYPLSISTRPRIKAVVRLVTPRNIEIKPREFLLVGEAVVNAVARYRLGGVKRPRLRIIFRDELGMVKVTRTVNHPGITIIPRARAALEVARGILAQASAVGSEEVHEVREYIPGDPIRRIHWKKSAKVQKLTIKLLQHQGFAGPMLVLSYVTDPVAMDRLSELMIYLTAELVARLPNIELYLVDRDGRLTTYVVDRNNYFKVISETLDKIENLNIRTVGGADYAGVLNMVRYSLWLRVKDVVAENFVIIGQRIFARPLCEALGDKVSCLTI
ncbi:MAG: DUF58 domain-containing protein [Vulcanisaeta sp.]|uniref:DUF58 domain-containing protein n=1 Tax=Vulcanisaeta sp. TaxID=2020871 RepID=UPI003D0DD203